MVLVCRENDIAASRAASAALGFSTIAPRDNSLLAAFFVAFQILIEEIDVTETILHATEEGLVDAGLRFGEGVMDPFAFATGHEQSRTPQIGEVT